MKGLFKNIVSVVLALVIMVTTSGFTVYEHYCNAVKTTEFAFLIPEFDCNHNGFDHHDELLQCCSEVHEMYGDFIDTGDCCDTDSHFVKLNITLNLQEMNKKMAPEIILYAGEDYFIRLASDSETPGTIISNDLPPPVSGKELHIYLHQLNIPYPSV